jgi:chromosomal replication initiation ATPase DnaA
MTKVTRIIKYPIPEGESKAIRNTRNLESYDEDEIVRFIQWAVTVKYRLKLDKFYSHYKSNEYILARAAIIYAIRTRWDISLKNLSKLIGREHSSLVRNQKNAIRYFGDKLKEVGKLLAYWDWSKRNGKTLPKSN